MNAVSLFAGVERTGNYSVGHIPASQGKDFVRRHHYSHGIHNGPMCYGMHDDSGELVGVCAFATPCSKNVCASVFGSGSKRSVTELHRLVLLDEIPSNSESWFIVRALKLLKKEHPNYRAVLSFADATEGHRGVIYQATNAIYTGTSGRATFYLDQDGRLRHPRQNGVNITPEESKLRGWKPTKRDGKHRYLFLLGSASDKKWSKANLLLPILDYPKAASNQGDTHE